MFKIKSGDNTYLLMLVKTVQVQETDKRYKCPGKFSVRPMCVMTANEGRGRDGSGERPLRTDGIPCGSALSIGTFLVAQPPVGVIQ